MVTSGLRGFPRRWLSRRRRGTLLGGVALGAVLIAAATLAGPIGLDPLPGRDAARRAEPAVPPAGGPLRAAQPEVGRTLLDTGDLPPGYTAGPPAADTSPPGPAADARATPGPTVPPPGAGPGPSHSDGALAGPFGTASEGASLVDSTLEGMFGGPAGRGSSAGPGGSAGPDGSAGPPGHAPEAGDTPDIDRGTARRLCAWLVSAPWALAVDGARPVVIPLAVDHHDVRRGVRLRHAVGGFADTGAADAVRRFRQVVTGCAGMAVTAEAPTGVGTGPAGAAGRPVRVTVRLRPVPPGVPAPTAAPGDAATAADRAPDEAYAAALTATATDGRAWTGQLAVDRVGPVLSMLWHIGPRGALNRPETTTARRAAVDKARPLAARLG